jgi:hypothetical protein
VAANVGIAVTRGLAVTCGVGVGVLDARGLVDGLGTTVGIAVPTAVDPGVALADAGGAVTTGLGLGATDGVPLDDGVAEGSLVGSVMARTVSSPAAFVPMTTASLRTGDFEIDFGWIWISTALDDWSETRAQSGWRSAGQTSLTFVRL